MEDGLAKEEVVPPHEDNNEVEDEGETRCVCGEVDPPDDSGLYIQCENCGVWQHGVCVGIPEGDDENLDKYWCEQCKPELHRLYTVESTGDLRSIYKPIQEKKNQSSRRRRGGARMKNSNENEQVEDSAKPAEDSPTDSNNKSQVTQQTPPHDNTEEEPEGDSSKILQDRQRATLSAREEKQYQWMLEKVLKESRRTSQQEDNAEDTKRDSDSKIGNAENHETFAVPVNRSVTVSPSATPASSQDMSSHSESNETTATSASQPTKKTTRSRRHQRVSKNNRRNTRNNDKNLTTASNNSKSSNIDINKPMKPRLPPPRTSLNEMRRRVAAVIEFISRTQWQLTQEQQSKEDLLRFVENQNFIQQVETIFNDHEEILKQMDDLTRSLLLWEKKYSPTTPTSTD